MQFNDISSFGMDTSFWDQIVFWMIANMLEILFFMQTIILLITKVKVIQLNSIIQTFH